MKLKVQKCQKIKSFLCRTGLKWFFLLPLACIHAKQKGEVGVIFSFLFYIFRIAITLNVLLLLLSITMNDDIKYILIYNRAFSYVLEAVSLVWDQMELI